MGRKCKSQIFFVYEDWTIENQPRCFYVGKGLSGRVENLRRNIHHTNIANKHGIHRKIVLSTTIEQLALDYEINLIAEHKTFVYASDYNFGANYTRGGEGVSGAKFVWSTQQRENARLAQKRRFQRPGELEKHAQATKKQWIDNNVRKAQQIKRMKISNPAHTHPDTERTRVKKHEGQIKRYSNPEERRLASERTITSCKNPEVFAKRSAAQKARRLRERQS